MKYKLAFISLLFLTSCSDKTKTAEDLFKEDKKCSAIAKHFNNDKWLYRKAKDGNWYCSFYHKKTDDLIFTLRDDELNTALIVLDFKD